MNRAARPQSLEQAVRTMRIIWAALLAGVVAFAVIAVLQAQHHPGRQDVFAIVGGLVGASSIMLGWLIGRMIRLGGARQALTDVAHDPNQSAETVAALLANTYQIALIIRLAMFEGAAFLNLIFYMVAGSPINLGLAGLCLAAMLFLFPSHGRLVHWAENQLTLFRDPRWRGRAGETTDKTDNEA